MFTQYLCLVIFVPPLFAGVVKQDTNYCSPTEFPCGDGGCISVELVCDGSRDCADGGDEFTCGLGSVTLRSDELVLNRTRRQASRCRKDQWACRDGSCISFDGKCDGVVDCPDGSDETHALCRKTTCQHNWFRCTYGACVDGTAPCNGIQECADNSDELLPRCRNETDEVRGQFKCQDGSSIIAANHCDGAIDCADGSDETVRACAGKTCPSYLFQCAYGACVDGGADCNKIQECADGSDESAELCDKNLPTQPIKPPKGNCKLPPYPDHGTYVSNIPNAKPGEAYDFVSINVTCRQGYGVEGSNSVYCHNGRWREEIPKCVLHCQLPPHPSVEYHCLVSGAVTGSRTCNLYEPTGTTVSPKCRSPNYYSPVSLTFMRCIDGNWDYIARCSPDCGRVTPDGISLVIGGKNTKHGEVPWHAGIYTKNTNPYMQICGGSLISTNMIISAAHCFWDKFLNKASPATNYAVAVGKIYRPFNNDHEDAQKSDVKDLHLPVRYQDSGANYQDDIAIVVTVLFFEYKPYIRPVCVDFDINFERRQLQPGKKGKVAGWGLVAENGPASPILQVVDLPYVNIETCISESPPNFRAFITSDKICAGFSNNGTALCKGDSGGGLAFPEPDKGEDRFYLRGIVSTAPNNEHLCNANTYTSFTQLIHHEHFIKQFWGA